MKIIFMVHTLLLHNKGSRGRLFVSSVVSDGNYEIFYLNSRLCTAMLIVWNFIQGAHIVRTQQSHQGCLTIIKMSILGSSSAKSVISYSRGRFTWHIILMTFIARLVIYMAVKNAVPDLYLLQDSKCTCSEYMYLFCVCHFTCLLYFDSLIFLKFILFR